MGWNVLTVSRDVLLNPERFEDLMQIISQSSVVISLNGASMLRRLTPKNKILLRESRIQAVGQLTNAMKQVDKKPRLFVSVSAVGIYEPGQLHSEYDIKYNDDFIGQLCREWEAEAMKANDLNIRTVVFRLGVVLGKQGGVIKKLFPLFKAGLGAIILPSSSSFPWVHISDLAYAFVFAAENENMHGVFNLAANEQTNQKHFAMAFAKALRRPLWLVMPPFVLRIIYGKGVDIITKNPFVQSVRLKEAGFNFEFSDIDEAMSDLLKKN